jgi:hypothetical protein
MQFDIASLMVVAADSKAKSGADFNGKTLSTFFA